MELFVDRLPTPIGNLFLVWHGPCLRALDFGDYEDRFYRLLKVHYGDCILTSAPAPAGIRGALAAYFEGEITAIDRIPVQTNGTPFQLKVWAALREIPSRRHYLVRRTGRAYREPHCQPGGWARQWLQPDRHRSALPSGDRSQWQADRLRRRTGPQALASGARARRAIRGGAPGSGPRAKRAEQALAPPARQLPQKARSQQNT